MKQRQLSMLVMLACVLAVVQLAGADEPITATFDQSYALGAGGVVSLENVNGDVRVEVWDRDEVRVYAVKEANSAKLLDELVIDVTADSDSVRIDTEYPKWRSHNDDTFGRHGHLQVEYTITMPRLARVDDIDLVNGNLTIEGVQGGVKAECVNGKVNTRDVAGEVNINTVNGTINTVFDTMIGVESIDLESVNGQLEVVLPPASPATVTAETVNGKLRNSFDIEVKKGKYVGASMRGDIAGGGGVSIDLETVNGGINVSDG